MLYEHLGKTIKEEDKLIEDEQELRMSLYKQALDDLESNDFIYFKETGPFKLSKMLDVFKIAIYGTIEDVISTFEQEWGDTIIQREEGEDEELCPRCGGKYDF